MCSQETDIDYEKATPAELFQRFHEALIELMASNDAEIDCFPLSRPGDYAFQLLLSDHAHEILDPIARPLRQTPEQIVSRLEEDGLIQFSGQTH